MKKYIIKAELAQAILDYLDIKPHKEVRPLIDGLMQLEEYKELNKKDGKRTD